MKLRFFKFGVDISPWWFLQKVETNEVEYIYKDRKISACQFNETIINVGEMITVDMLYNEEPIKNKEEEII